MADRLLVHIGYHKTGTSWLQQTVFAEEPFLQPWTSMQIAEELILPHDLDFQPERSRQSLDAAIPVPDEVERVVTLSWERLSGSPHAGGFDSATIARRLHGTFPEARVLIGIREQRGAVLALYRQYVRDGGTARIDGYLRPRNPAEIPQFRFEHLAYDKLVLLYMELFGRSQVMVLPFELLRTDPRSFAKRVRRFAGVESDLAGTVDTGAVNPRLSDWTTRLKRHANKVFVRSSLSPGARYYVKDHEQRFERLDRLLRHVPEHAVQRSWTSTVDSLVGARYKLSNARLAEITGCDLATLGYDLPE